MLRAVTYFVPVVPAVNEEELGVGAVPGRQLDPVGQASWWEHNSLRVKTIHGSTLIQTCPLPRALCRITLLPVTHVLVDKWMLTVKPLYKLSNVPDDLKWATNIHDTIYTHFQGITNNIYGVGRLVLLLNFLPVHHLSTHISTRPNDRWMGLNIKLCQPPPISKMKLGTFAIHKYY